MAPHQLVLVVEGNLVMLPYWPAIRSEYLDPIIAGLASDTQGLSEPPEYGLVVFYTHSFQSSCLLQQTGWTNNVEEFGGWLNRIDFCGGGCAEAAVAEGLAEGLAVSTRCQSSVSLFAYLYILKRRFCRGAVRRPLLQRGSLRGLAVMTLRRNTALSSAFVYFLLRK